MINLSFTKQLSNAIFHRFFTKIIICICVFSFLCLNGFTKSHLQDSNYITFNYPLASQGKNPNGTRLNIYDIVSEPVLTNTINNTGLAGEIQWKELADMLTIRATKTRIPEEEYIATEYQIQLNMKEPIAGIYAEDLLHQVMKSYSEYYYTYFIENQAIFSMVPYAYDPNDYHSILSYITVKYKLLSSYLNTRINENASFISPKTGESFSSLLQRINDFSSISLEKLRAYINNYGLTNNPKQYISEQQYGLRQATSIYDKFMIKYIANLNAIETYKLDQSAIVMIPTQDTSGEFYMSRTKTGIDYLSSTAVEFMDKAKNQAYLINLIKLLIENSTETYNSDNANNIIKNADEMSDFMLTEINELENLIKTTDNDYIQLHQSNFLVVNHYKPSTLSEYNVKNSFVITAIVFIILSLFSYSVIVYKKNKNK